MTVLTVLSLGAGVQSTTLALMAGEGKLPRPDVAIFADTGWEPQRVYDHLGRLEQVMAAAGIPLHRVSAGNLRTDAISPQHRYASIPYFVRNPDGSDGMGRRQCTKEYKLVPINREVRRLLGASAPHYRRVPRGARAEQWIGFSADEVGRVDPHRGVSYITKRYPLLELGMTRNGCLEWLAARGWTTVEKSACIGCPYHGNAQWRQLRDTCSCGHHRDAHGPDALACATVDHAGTGCGCSQFATPEWDDAVAFDRDIRKGGARGLPLHGEAFLHRSRVPLADAPIDRRTRGERRGDQLSVLDMMEPTGAGLRSPALPPPAETAYDAEAGDVAEYGDPDGCSPYGCRSGASVEAAT